MVEEEVWAESMCGRVYVVPARGGVMIAVTGHCVLLDSHPGGHLSWGHHQWLTWHSDDFGLVVGVEPS